MIAGPVLLRSWGTGEKMAGKWSENGEGVVVDERETSCYHVANMLPGRVMHSFLLSTSS